MSRTYSLTVIKALFARSGNLCAIPGCQETLVRDDGDGEPYSFGDIAHIHDYRSSSVRRRNWEIWEDPSDENNLLLVCPNHHREIDRNSGQYPVWKLRMLKSAHERIVLGSAVEAKRRTDPALLKTLAPSISFDFRVPGDYKRIAISIAESKLLEVLETNKKYGVDDSRDLYDLNHTIGRYLNCVDQHQKAQPLFDECVRLYPKIFSESSEEGRQQKAQLLHEWQGNRDEHRGEVEFCSSEFGLHHERTLQARICMCCSLIASGHLDEASATLDAIERDASSEHGLSPEIIAYINMQRGKLLLCRAEYEAGQTKVAMATGAIELLLAADRYFTAASSEHVTAKVTQFFLMKAYRLAGHIDKAEGVRQQIKGYFEIAPHAGMCHYSALKLRSELGVI